MASAASIASLSSAVETAIVRRESVGARRGLEEVLRVNKPALIALLKNPARSPADADLVRKAQTDGIRLPHRANPDSGDTGSVLQRLPSQACTQVHLLCFGWGEKCQMPKDISGFPSICVNRCYAKFETKSILIDLEYYPIQILNDYQRSWRSRLYYPTCSCSTRSPRCSCFSGEKSREEINRLAF